MKHKVLLSCTNFDSANPVEELKLKSKLYKYVKHFNIVACANCCWPIRCLLFTVSNFKDCNDEFIHGSCIKIGCEIFMCILHI